MNDMGPEGERMGGMVMAARGGCQNRSRKGRPTSLDLTVGVHPLSYRYRYWAYFQGIVPSSTNGWWMGLRGLNGLGWAGLGPG